MKILHIMASCARGSGVAQVIMRYYRQIHKEVVFDFFVYWDVEDSFKEEIEQMGGRVFVRGKPGVREMFRFAREFDSFLQEHEGEYTTVHLHELYLNAFLFPVVKKHKITRRIAHSHTTKLSEFPLNAIRNRILFFPVRYLATDFYACSYDAGKAAFGKRICDGPRFRVLKNAIDPSINRFSAADREKVRREFGLTSELVLGHIGRFSPQKNHTFLLDAFYEVQKRVEDARLLLIGDGPFFDDVRKKAQDLGIAHKVIQTGVRADVGALLSAMDIFVFPSVFEGLGIVLIEAQCNGLPCIASDVVPDEARVLPSYQMLSLKQSPQQWAEAIVACAKERDAQALQKVEAAGYDIATAAKTLYNKYCEREA